jgi:hypothetical protein
MASNPTPVQQVVNDITADEAQFIAALRAAKTDAEQDGVQLITDAKAAESYLWTSLQNVLNPPAPAAAGKK